MHVDYFIEDETQDSYARLVFEILRLPAEKFTEVDHILSYHPLYCTYKQARFKVSGCSSMGDVWLVSDPEATHSYDHRVNIMECSEWSNTFSNMEKHDICQ